MRPNSFQRLQAKKSSAFLRTKAERQPKVAGGSDNSTGDRLWRDQPEQLNAQRRDGLSGEVFSLFEKLTAAQQQSTSERLKRLRAHVDRALAAEAHRIADELVSQEASGLSALGHRSSQNMTPPDSLLAVSFERQTTA